MPSGSFVKDLCMQDDNDNDNSFFFKFNHKHDKYYTKLAPALPIYGNRRGRPRARDASVDDVFSGFGVWVLVGVSVAFLSQV